MKKEYKTPTMKVVEVQQRLLLSGSPDSMEINNELGDGYEENAW